MADGSALAAKEVEAETRAPKAAGKGRYRVRRFKVDFWATDFNLTEIGILKDTQHEAASDQFTKDMEIIGQTVDEGERSAVIAYREGAWKEQTDFDRRLVVKLFSENFNWRGSLELLMGRSLQLTRGTGVPVPAFSINLARHDQLIEVERCARKWPLVPEVFTFFIQTKSGPRFYTLRRHFFSIGADYSLFDQQGRRIGHLDEQVINLGGAWIVKLNAEHTNSKLETVLELFCAMLKFNKDCRRHVKRLAHRVRDGKISPTLNHHEARLYYNPRKWRS